MEDPSWYVAIMVDTALGLTLRLHIQLFSFYVSHSMIHAQTAKIEVSSC